MYSVDLKHLKKYIIKTKKGLLEYVKKANNNNGCSAVVLAAEWYEQHQEHVDQILTKHLPDWRRCEIYRDLHGVRIAAVVALKSNNKPSSRINKRVVDRAFRQGYDPVCAYTREVIERDDASAEHIIPLSSGGNNSVWNICVADAELNNYRGNRNFWRYWRSLLSSML